MKKKYKKPEIKRADKTVMAVRFLAKCFVDKLSDGNQK